MNNSKQDILNNLIKEPFINQRILAAQTGHSLGIVNRSIKELISEGYLDGNPVNYIRYEGMSCA